MLEYPHVLASMVPRRISPIRTLAELPGAHPVEPALLPDMSIPILPPGPSSELPPSLARNPRRRVCALRSLPRPGQRGAALVVETCGEVCALVADACIEASDFPLFTSRRTVVPSHSDRTFRMALRGHGFLRTRPVHQQRQVAQGFPAAPTTSRLSTRSPKRQIIEIRASQTIEILFVLPYARHREPMTVQHSQEGRMTRRHRLTR